MVRGPEFDNYARDYSGGNEDPLKRLFGGTLDQFVNVKARWLWNYLRKGRNGTKLSEDFQLLDFGCGTGEMLRWLNRFGFPGAMQGADVSPAMLQEAEKRWGDAPRPLFSLIDETTTHFEDNTFSCIVATCVFHHIEPGKRDTVLREIKRILKPGGIVVIFEHNPLNPLTRLIVKRAVIDKNAFLLFPRETSERFDRLSLVNEKLEYIMFFPLALKVFYFLEKYLAGIPLGAQYAAVGRKNDDRTAKTKEVFS